MLLLKCISLIYSNFIKCSKNILKLTFETISLVETNGVDRKLVNLPQKTDIHNNLIEYGFINDDDDRKLINQLVSCLVIEL